MAFSLIQDEPISLFAAGEGLFFFFTRDCSKVLMSFRKWRFDFGLSWYHGPEDKVTKQPSLLHYLNMLLLLPFFLRCFCSWNSLGRTLSSVSGWGGADSWLTPARVARCRVAWSCSFTKVLLMLPIMWSGVTWFNCRNKGNKALGLSASMVLL